MAPNVGLGTQGPEQRGWALYLWSIIMVIVAGLFVAVRLLATGMRKRLGSDDWTILAALVSIRKLPVQSGYSSDVGELGRSRRSFCPLPRLKVCS